MFESKINRGRANGYAPLDGSGKVPLDKLPPIQSTIDTGSFATTGSNTFTGTQTIVGPSNSLIIEQTNIFGNDSFRITATGSANLLVTSNNISLFGVTEVNDVENIDNNASLFANIANSNYGGGVATGPVASILTTASGSIPNYWFFDASGSSFLPGDVYIGHSGLGGDYSGSLNIRNGNINLSGSLSLTGNIGGALALVDNVEIFTSQINFVPNSSGEVGSNLSTIQLVPDVNSPSADQMLIIDPTGGFPNHIHLRPGGPMDNSSTSIILGGENSNVSVVGGENPPVQITSNNYVWQFDTDGTITFPDYSVQTTAFTGINTSSFATTGSNVFKGQQIISGAFNVSISANAFGVNENPIANNIFWSYIPNDTNTTSIENGWVANIETVGTYTVTNVEYDYPFVKITLDDGLLELPYRCNGYFSLASKELKFGTDGVLKISGSVAISQGIHNWEFGSDGILKLNNGIGEVYADPTDFSVRIGTADENVAPNTQIIIGGPDAIFKVKAGPPLKEWDFALNGDFNLTGSINGASNLATTGSNQFNGNQTITGSLVHGNAGNIATGENSHAEGEGTQAIGNFSHAEGLGTIAYGNYSHAEGQDTVASGSHSHAEGNQTIALANHQHVQGQYNAVSSVPAAFIVGNGTDAENRSNLIHAAGNEVQITGSLNISGSGSLNGSNIVSSNTIQKIETISSASYAALTPVSGTLYIIIG